MANCICPKDWKFPGDHAVNCPVYREVFSDSPLTKRLRENGGFTEGELATIRALVSESVAGLFNSAENGTVTISKQRLTNLHSIARILSIV